MSCPICRGEENAYSSPEETGGTTIIMFRHAEDGELMTYFNVQEYDAFNTMTSDTPTPDFICCPFCGDAL